MIPWPLILALLPSAVPVQPGHTGLWFDPEHPGHGLFLHIVTPEQAALSWNVFAPDGSPLWLFGDGRIEGERIRIEALRVLGGGFPPLFPPGAIRLEGWGRLELRFLSCEAVELRWEPRELPPGQRTLRRLSYASGTRCEERTGSWQASSLGEAPVAAARGWNGRRAAVYGSELFLATRDGLWRRRLDGGGSYERAGLAGLEVLFVQGDPGPEGRLFAGVRPRPGVRPLFVSRDGGRSWENASSSPVGLDDPFEPFVEVRVHPRRPEVLFAALEGGAGIAWSRDGGRTWRRADGAPEPLFGYPCHLAFVPAFPDRLYQGCEAILDFVEVRYYPLDLARDPPLGPPVAIARTGDDTLPDLGNRRPNALSATPGRADALYLGLEGAVVVLSPFRGLERIYWSPLEEGPTDRPYVYVHALWVAPDNPAHLIFGGGINGENRRLHLYETRDHGRSLSLLPAPALRDPRVDSIHALDADGRQLLVLVLDRQADGSERLLPLRYRFAE